MTKNHFFFIVFSLFVLVPSHALATSCGDYPTVDYNGTTPATYDDDVWNSPDIDYINACVGPDYGYQDAGPHYSYVNGDLRVTYFYTPTAGSCADGNTYMRAKRATYNLVTSCEPVPTTVDITFMFDGQLVSGSVNPDTGAVNSSSLQFVEFPGYINTDGSGNPCYTVNELRNDGTWASYNIYPDGSGVGIVTTPDWYTGGTDSDSLNTLNSNSSLVYNDANTNLDEYSPAYVPQDQTVTTRTYQDEAGRNVTEVTTITKNPDGSESKQVDKTTDYPGGGSYTNSTTKETDQPPQQVEFDDSGLRSDLSDIKDINSQMNSTLSSANNTLTDIKESLTVGDGAVDSGLSELDSGLSGLSDTIPSGQDVLDQVPTDVSTFPVSETVSSYLKSQNLVPECNDGELCFDFQGYGSETHHCFDPLLFVQFKLIFSWSLYGFTLWRIFNLLTESHA